MLKGRPSRWRARLTRRRRAVFGLTARDGFAAQPHFGIDLHLESHLAAEFGQHIHVAGGLVAEVEVVALVHFAGMQLLLRMSSANCRGVISERSRVKGSSSTASSPLASSRRSFSGVGVSSFRPESGRRMRDGMRLEGDGDRLGVLLRARCARFPEHSAVRAMDAVKVAHADDRRAEVGRNVFEFVKDLHAVQALQQTA